MKTNNSTENILNKIYDYSLEEIMGLCFGRYSKYIIQDRAIPDVRDGLKPVQRRILYAMYLGHNTYDKPYRKSAKTVGDVIGSFHPHGDSSIYEAMVRLSQSWKMNTCLIDMHGNNGSIDGDSPAAYRYTEARLSKIANELLVDIEKNTVPFSPNFDDSVMEPTVLPAKFPNLLVNGTTGISAGYATNIPPHNLEEVIDATIKRIDNESCSIDTILDIIKGPDFPTGGIAMDTESIRNALKTGKGRVVVRSKVEVVKDKGKTSLVVSEIPFDVLKVSIVKKIDEIRIEHKIDGIADVRDESDKDGLRIVVDLKKDFDSEVVLNYLYKNTELQASYNYNMVAIVNRRPKLLSVLEIIDAYIVHLKEVVLERTKFDLEHAKKRFHILEGLIKAISILDEVVSTIRSSKNKTDAKENLVKSFDFTMEQAEAIVMLQLYRLTNTDITMLQDEIADLKLKIETFSKIISDNNALKYVVKKELKQIKSSYPMPRKTSILDTVAEIKLDTLDLISKEDVVCLVTHDGYIKRISRRAYLANTDEAFLKENDYVLGLFEVSTLDTILLFTNLGNYLYMPVYEFPEVKWKVLGKHISNYIPISEDEEIVACIPVYDFSSKIDIIMASSNGMIKKTRIDAFKVSRYSKPICCMKLKDDDRLIWASVCSYSDVMVTTAGGYFLWFDTSEIAVSSPKAYGVKSISLKNDKVVSMNVFDNTLEYVTVFTDKGTAKRVKLSFFEKMSRARRGLMILREVKSNPHKIVKAFVNSSKEVFGIKEEKDISYVLASSINISDRYKTGGSVSHEEILDVFLKNDLIKKDDSKDILEEDNSKSNAEQLSLLEIDDQLKKIDDIIN